MVQDKFGTEIKCGDMVCFVGNPNADWRQTKELVRVQVKAIISNKATDYILYDENCPKVSTNRVVKCY
jgi:hypothetical protein